jgi:hypothetical protein
VSWRVVSRNNIMGMRIRIEMIRPIILDDTQKKLSFSIYYMTGIHKQRKRRKNFPIVSINLPSLFSEYPAMTFSGQTEVELRELCFRP